MGTNHGGVNFGRRLPPIGGQYSTPINTQTVPNRSRALAVADPGGAKKASRRAHGAAGGIDDEGWGTAGALGRGGGSVRYERLVVESLLRMARVYRAVRTRCLQRPGIGAPAAPHPTSSEAPTDEPEQSGRSIGGPPQAPDSLD